MHELVEFQPSNNQTKPMKIDGRIRVHSEFDELVLDSLVAMSHEKGDFLYDLERHGGISKLQHILHQKSIQIAVDTPLSDFSLDRNKVIRQRAIKLLETHGFDNSFYFSRVNKNAK